MYDCIEIAKDEPVVSSRKSKRAGFLQSSFGSKERNNKAIILSKESTRSKAIKEII